MKNCFKYLTFTLAITIFTILIIIIITEEKLKQKTHNKNIFENLTKEEFCQRQNKTKYIFYLSKCFMAFFSGFLCTEMKFLKIGLI
jgi:hypothetical protein